MVKRVKTIKGPGGFEMVVGPLGVLQIIRDLTWIARGKAEFMEFVKFVHEVEDYLMEHPEIK